MSRAPHAPSWYAQSAHYTPERPPARGALRVDVAVVGGGFAGLCAALELAQSGVDVALFEAHSVGWGASGRNGGQLEATPRREIHFYERSMGQPAARRVMRIAQDANAYVKELIQRHAIQCDLGAGCIEVQHCPGAGDELQDEIARMRDVYELETLEYLTPQAVAQATGAVGHYDGVLDHAAGHLHPLNYALGLARAASAAGVRIFEGSEVLKLEADGAQPRLQTAQAEVTADKMIIAANGYLRDLAPKAARLIAPIHNFIIATEPLGANFPEILPIKAAVADTRHTVRYYRRTPCGRLLFGGGETAGGRAPEDIEAMVRPRMEAVFPQLKEVRVTHAWGGALAITRHRAPAFVRLGPAAVLIGGWSGSGVHMASMGGKIAACAAMGDSQDFDLLAQAPQGVFPPEPLRTPLLQLAIAYYGFLDRL